MLFKKRQDNASMSKVAAEDASNRTAVAESLRAAVTEIDQAVSNRAALSRQVPVKAAYDRFRAVANAHGGVRGTNAYHLLDLYGRVAMNASLGKNAPSAWRSTSDAEYYLLEAIARVCPVTTETTWKTYRDAIRKKIATVADQISNG